MDNPSKIKYNNSIRFITKSYENWKKQQKLAYSTIDGMIPKITQYFKLFENSDPESETLEILQKISEENKISSEKFLFSQINANLEILKFQIQEFEKILQEIRAQLKILNQVQGVYAKVLGQVVPENDLNKFEKGLTVSLRAKRLVLEKIFPDHLLSWEGGEGSLEESPNDHLIFYASLFKGRFFTAGEFG